MNPVDIITTALALLKAGEEIAASVKRLRDIAQQNGATPEQLKDLDDRLTDAIARREAELRVTTSSTQPGT